MIAVKETIENENSRHLSFNQKFWLLCVGGPLFLIVSFLIIAISIPKPLNPTEKKLLGKWEVVSPANPTPVIIEFRENEVVHGSRSWSWEANDDYLITDMLSGSPSVLRRIKLSIGLAEDVKWSIESLNQKEFRINHAYLPDPMVFKRIDSDKN